MNFANLSIKRPIFITCIVALMLVMGYTSLKRMSVDQFPDVTFPIIFVQTIYPGASPVDMEKLVSKPIEDEMSSLAGLNKLTSINSEALSYVILEFRLGTDIKDSETQVRQRLGNIRRNLPDDIEEPVIRRFDPADQPIVRLALVSEMDPGKIYDIVDEKIKAQFETLPGVGIVNLLGARKTEIQVLVDKDKLQNYDLNLLQVADRIRNTSKDVPIGKLDSGDKETVMRATGEFSTVNQLKNVSVNFLGSDKGIPLSAIAEINRGLEERKTIVGFQSREGNWIKKPAVFLEIYKQSGANTVKVADAVKAQVPKVNELMKERGVDLQIEYIRDGARPIRMNIFDVRESILIGIALCIVVVFLFLGSARSTFITGMALPNSLLGAFVIMAIMGFTINIMTLLALSLAVGLLIDDAIVVRENIFRHLEMGKKPIQAALDGTKEVSMAVIATTMVVIAVFGPIAFLDGIVGQFFKQFGLTMVFAMLISLFDAFTVAPMLSAYWASSSEHVKGTGPVGRLLSAFDRMQSWLEDKYEATLRWTIRHRLVVLVLTSLVFVSSLVVLVAFVPKTFLPTADNGEFSVNIEMPVGTALDETQRVVEYVEGKLKENSSIDLISAVVGQAQQGQYESNKAALYVRLVPSNERKFKTSAVKTQVRESLVDIDKRSFYTIGDIDIGGGGDKPFQLAMTGDNFEELATYVDKLKERMKEIPGLVDVDTNYRLGKPEFHVVFNRAQSEKLGVSTVTAGSELRARVEGIVASTYREAGKEYDIRVRLRNEDKDLRKVFASTEVPNVNHNMIPLTLVAKGEETKGFSQINRQNKSRYINISANLGPNGNLGNISAEVEKILKSEMPMPTGVNYRFIGQAENFKELIENMVTAMALGVLFIYLVLASLYESFITPLAILLALPPAMSGAFYGLLVTGKTIDIFSLIGVVMLLGVAAKNSILLVDYANHLIKEGMERGEALIQSGRVRLRPILMTSLALVAGTVPIAIGLNEASAQRTSMGVAIIGGLVSSTALTLVVVPAAFGYIDDFRLFLGRVLKKMQNQG